MEAVLMKYGAKSGYFGQKLKIEHNDF